VLEGERVRLEARMRELLDDAEDRRKDAPMSDDNEEYERSRDEANRLADMETQLEPGLAEPAPAGFVAERDVDWDKVQHLIFSDAPPEARAAIRAGELRWALSGFDGTVGERVSRR
jgi:hypothetical protein